MGQKTLEQRAAKLVLSMKDFFRTRRTILYRYLIAQGGYGKLYWSSNGILYSQARAISKNRMDKDQREKIKILDQVALLRISSGFS